MRTITKNIFYVGADDHSQPRFEGQYDLTNGMAYNSYVIMDEKITVMDTVDIKVQNRWMKNLEEVLGDQQPSYLVVQHMEPDHSGSITRFLRTYPGAVVVATRQAFTMMKQFYGEEYEDRRIIVAEGDSLCLGKHNLHFVTAPMVHWPEVMLSYESTEKVLFSADAFGKFGAIDADEYWECEARRYYIGIVGKYGAQVQRLLKKAANLDISVICPLHGPYLSDNIQHYIDLYDTWSSYRPEDKGVVILYCTVYGHTEDAAMWLYRRLDLAGYEVYSHRLGYCDMAEAVEDAFRFDKVVLVSTTYNGGMFPYMEDLLHRLKERNFQGRSVFLIENGSWAPNAANAIKKSLESCKDLTFVGEPIRIISKMSEENRAQLEEMAQCIMNMDKETEE